MRHFSTESVCAPPSYGMLEKRGGIQHSRADSKASGRNVLFASNVAQDYILSNPTCKYKLNFKKKMTFQLYDPFIDQDRYR